MKEVFILRRLNRWDKKFGFVRFFEVENAKRLEKDLDQIYIGNVKLYVNIPRYRRSKVEDVSGPTREVRRKSRPTPFINIKEEVWREKKGKEVWKLKKRKQSFAKVVRNSSQEKWKRSYR